MTKSTTAGMDTHLAGNVLTLAYILRFESTTGTVVGMTEHDEDIIYNDGAGSVTYRASPGIRPRAIESEQGGVVDNTEIQGFLDANGFDEDDIRNGDWNFSEVKVYIVNYDDLADGDIKLRKGTLGEVEIDGSQFRAEIRGLSQKINQEFMRVYTNSCPYDLGDLLCGIDLNAYKQSGSVTSFTNRSLFVTTALSTVEVTAPHIGFNLTVANPSFDTGLTGWTQELSVWEASRSKRPFSRNYTSSENKYNRARPHGDLGNDPDAILYQDLDLVAEGVPTASIDAGETNFDYSAYIQSKNKIDSGELQIQFLDSVDAVIPATDLASGLIISEDVWRKQNIAAAIPALTRKLRIKFHAQSPNSDDADVGFDDVTVSIDGTSIVAQTGWFNGGHLEWLTGNNAGRKMEVKTWDASTNTLQLFLLMPEDIQNGDTFEIFPGCDKTLEICINRYGNVLNFGGFPYIPGRDKILRFPNNPN